MSPPSFGLVDPVGDHFLLHVGSGAGAFCTLTLVARADRGYQRHELAVIPAGLWRQISAQAARELEFGMGEREKDSGNLLFHAGEMSLSPLIGRELAVLLWALAEDAEGNCVDSLMAGWRQLAREERWWLYARASGITQRQGQGWRRALFFALSDPADTRTAPRILELAEAAASQKKSPSPKLSVRYSSKQRPAKQAPKPLSRKQLPTSQPKMPGRNVKNSPRPQSLTPLRTPPPEKVLRGGESPRRKGRMPKAAAA